MLRRLALSTAVAATLLLSLASTTLAVTATGFQGTRLVAPVGGGDCHSGTSFQTARIVPICTTR